MLDATGLVPALPGARRGGATAALDASLLRSQATASMQFVPQAVVGGGWQSASPYATSASKRAAASGNVSRAGNGGGGAPEAVYRFGTAAVNFDTWEVREQGEPLLDRTMILFGSGMSYGHSHCNSNLPILLAGGKGLGLKHGQHLDYNRPHLKEDYSLSYDEWRSLCGKPKDDKARLSNVFVTMLQKMEINAEQFVDSLGPVSEVI
jgi:hypothetical protein